MSVTPIDILGCRLDPIDVDEATERVLALARSGGSAQVVTLGTEMVVHAQHDEAFRKALNGSALSLCDTAGVLAVARRQGAALRARVTGVELVEHLCARAAKESVSLFLLGGAQGVADDAAAVLEIRYPGLTIAGTRNGYFLAEESAAVAGAIKASGARLLLVGLGSPRQELWLAEFLAATGCGAGIGVGGSFDVIGGRVQRAPLIWQRLNLEWLYRLMREPQRWRRQLALPYFVWLVTLQRFGLGAKKGMNGA